MTCGNSTSIAGWTRRLLALGCGMATVDDLAAGRERVLRGRCGVIETRNGRLHAIHLRPWPRRISLLEVAWHRRYWRPRQRDDRCWLYYSHPWGRSAFLALNYVVTCSGTRYGTVAEALRTLDRIAWLKDSLAAVCEVTHPDVRDRHLGRHGWVRHVAGSRRRHYIKRFYGVYPEHCRPEDWG